MTTVLVIGDKRYSSWSLRAWLGLRHAGLPFQEIKVKLRQPDTRAQILPHSPSGKVPLLKHGGIVVWESLAILEYLAELVPSARLWPSDPAARAEARAVAAEMHAGFVALRRDMPMDCTSRLTVAATDEVKADIARIVDIWHDCRRRRGSGDRFLFGSFGAADAMFAPVVSRFVTYGVELPAEAAVYRDAVMALPALREWVEGAAAET